MKKYLPLFLVLGLFGALTVFSAQAAQGARESLRICAATLAPSLLPFFVLSNLLSSLGLPELLSGSAGRTMARLFRVSPGGIQAFFLGLSGGYPLGASVVADLRRDGRVSRDEAERLLAFCNNSGPAFIIGAAGGVFQSPRAGLLLYAAHVLAAVAVGVLFRPRQAPEPAPSGKAPPESVSFARALPAAVARAVGSVMTVCGYVVLFGALVALVEPYLRLPAVANALFLGFLELGSGVTALGGLAPTPATLAAASLILGWGGLSVHCQTMGVLADTDISCARHLAGRALCGLIAAVFTFLAAQALF